MKVRTTRARTGWHEADRPRLGALILLVPVPFRL